jgi:S-(hydroxymethyl)glutathione dehydrogenase/alcohol dehydrogenase
MKTDAAILIELQKPLAVASIEIPPLLPGQVLVDISYSGICHTQLSECRGTRGEDKFLPHCLGHEGSGVVREIGSGVTKVKVGDRVIISWIKGTGADISSTVYLWGNKQVNAGGVTTFSRQSVISENRLTVIPNDISLEAAALVGCAVPTGMGAVLNTARPRPGQSIAIFGTGGIGLCAVAGAAISGCAPIIAIDINPEKLTVAKKMGATNCICSKTSNPLEEIMKICPGGIDFAIEATGIPDVMNLALTSVRAQGGVAVVIGNANFKDKLIIDPRQLNMGKQLRGTWGGDNNPDIDFPRYCHLIKYGRLNLEPLMSPAYSLSNINQALTDLAMGHVVRPLIDMSRE